MGKEMICRDCGIEFDPSLKKEKKGFRDQCPDCSENDPTIPILGFNDGSLNKSTSISLYKGSDDRVRKSIQNQRSRTGGF